MLLNPLYTAPLPAGFTSGTVEIKSPGTYVDAAGRVQQPSYRFSINADGSLTSLQTGGTPSIVGMGVGDRFNAPNVDVVIQLNVAGAPVPLRSTYQVAPFDSGSGTLKLQQASQTAPTVITLQQQVDLQTLAATAQSNTSQVSDALDLSSFTVALIPVALNQVNQALASGLASVSAATGTIAYAGGDHTTLPAGIGLYRIVGSSAAALLEAGQIWERTAGGVARRSELEGVSATSLPAVRVASIAALRARVGNGSPVQTLGYYGTLSGGAATYDPDSSDTTTPDNGARCIVGADGTRYKLRGAISARKAGAKGDWTTDDTAAFAALALESAVTVEAGRYRVTSRLRMAYNGTTTADYCTWTGEGEGVTVIIGDFNAGQTGMAVLEVGSSAKIQNFGHVVTGIAFRHGPNTPADAWGVRWYNAYGGKFAGTIRARNCLDLSRTGVAGFTFLNFLVDSSVLYAKYVTDTSGNEVYLGASDSGKSVGNTGYAAGAGTGSRWDDVTFRHTTHNALCEMAGTLVTFDTPQLYNQKKTTWIPTQSGYNLSDLSNACMWMIEGSLTLKTPNFEVYQNALVIGGYNRVVNAVNVEDGNFNGIAYSSGEEMAANAIVLHSGGVGTTGNVTLTRPKFAQNRSDVTLDNGGNNSNGSPYVSNVKIIDPVLSESAFSYYHGGITASSTDTIDTGDDRLRKEFFQNGSRIRIAGVLHNIIAYPGPTSLKLEAAITVTGADYARVNTVPVRRVVVGTFQPGQIRVVQTADLTQALGVYQIGDAISNPAPLPGGLASSVATAAGRYHGSAGTITSGSGFIGGVTRIETWTAGDAISGPGIPAGTVVGLVNPAGSLILGSSVVATVTTAGAELYGALVQKTGSIPADPAIVVPVSVTPAPPTLAYDLGTSGTLALVSATTVDADPTRPRYQLQYTWTPGSAATSLTRLLLTGPTGGYQVAAVSVFGTDNVGPRLMSVIAVAAPNVYAYFANPAGNLAAVTLSVFVGYSR